MTTAAAGAPRPFASVVVSNWEGEAFLPRCLSSLQLSARRCGFPVEILMVDDASRDGSAALVRDRFPGVRLLCNQENLGFGRTTMRGVRAARGRVVVLCNNDLAATGDFLPNLLRWFRDPPRPEVRGRRLFAVGARTLRWSDGDPQHVCMVARWRGGRLNPEPVEADRPRPCDFVQAGAAAYDRRMVLRLGGFRRLYEPAYWEDYDLSYRAVRRGALCLYDPEALALHHGGGSMSRLYGEEGVARLRARNHLLFEWTNLRGADWARWAARLPVSVAAEWLSGREPRLTRALADAAGRLAQARRGAE